MGQSAVRPGYHRSRIGWSQRLQPSRPGYSHEAAQSETLSKKIRMKTFSRIFWGGLALLVFLFLSFSSYHATDSTEVGVRTIKWFGKKGVDPLVYQPGSAYFFFPLFNEWDVFD